MQLVLASTSPRRRELLSLLGVPFATCAPHYEEQFVPGLPPSEQVLLFAMEKARSISALRPTDLVLGGDTVIDVDGEGLGKPADMAEARAMLRRLAGRTHQVHTAVALSRIQQPMKDEELVTAWVTMKPYDSAAVEAYLATGESFGKAGAYSIQGRAGELIAEIQGDFTAVVGLPLRAVARLLMGAGLTVPRDIDVLYREKPYQNWSRFSG
jgi:septum formation protein